MFKRMMLVVLVVSALVLAFGIGPRFAHATPPTPAGMTIPYPGRLSNDAGQPVADGVYDFSFALYDAKTGGTLLWSESQQDVPVKSGAFVTTLGSVNPLSAAALGDSNRWLAVSVRGPGQTDFVALNPRQQLSTASTAVPTSPQALSCAHTHLGEVWEASLGWSLAGLRINNSLNGPAFWGVNNGGGNGVRGESSTGLGVFGSSSSSYGVQGNSTSSHGIYGESSGTSANASGVYGKNTSTTGQTNGVWGETASDSAIADGVWGLASNTSGQASGVVGETKSPDGHGGTFKNQYGGIALYASGTGGGADHSALVVTNTQTVGGIAAYLNNNSGYATANLTNNGAGEVLYLQNNGGDFLRGVNGSTNIFRLAANGVGHASSGWVTGGADFAEMLPAATELEPGDVLVIGPDGKLVKSTEPYQPTVAGVYSTKPGFVGGEAVDGKSDGEIPLAIVGVVPAKVSAENGAICPGDLLVASATPGHAMKAGANPPQGTVIGKALEGLDKGTGVIKMLVTLQ
jgi:hypothetical protein